MKIFRGLKFILFPKTRSKIELKRINLWELNGAKVQYDLTDVTKQDSTKNPVQFLIINDQRKKLSFEELYSQLEITNVDRLSQLGLPIVNLSWLVNCMESGELIPFDVYKVENFQNKLVHKVPKRTPTPSGSPAKKRKVHELDDEGSTKREQKLISILTRKRERGLISTKFEINLKIIKVFQHMLELLEQEKVLDNTIEFRIKQYRNAINVIEDLDGPILSVQELKNTPGIGTSILTHINDIISTGTFPNYEAVKRNITKNKELKLVNQISRIHGFGPLLAYKLIKKFDIQIFDELRTRSEVYGSLSRPQKMGLTHFDDWQLKIPREEIESHLEYIRNESKLHVDPELKINVVGSYMRNKPFCGDIDIIVYKEGLNSDSEISMLLYRLVNQLKSTGYIECDLTEVYPKMSKFMGGGRLNPKSSSRRIDILSVPHDELGAAYLYFVGNDMFNRYLRLLATYKGYHLNEKGLFDGSQSEVIEKSSEKKILEILGVGWVDYGDRNI